MGAQAQIGTGSPDPFSLSSRQLLQPKDGDAADRTGNVFYAEFDDFGNRIVDLTPGTTTQTVNYRATNRLSTIAEDLGPKAQVKYSPILALPVNPEELRPSVDVLMRLGTLDLAKPSISYGFIHDSNINLPNSNQTDSTSRNLLGGEFRIQSATDRAKRTTIQFGYRPSWTKFLKYTELDTLNHQSFLSIVVPFRRVTTGFASTFSKTMTPTLLLGGGGDSLTFDNTLNLAADLGPKFSFSSNASYSIADQNQPFVSSLIEAPAITTTTATLSANLNYVRTQKLSLSTGLTFGLTRQDGLNADIAGFSGDLNRLSPNVGLTYIPSEKLTATMSLGITRNEEVDTGEINLNPSVQLSTTYQPSPSWQVSASVGTTTLTAPGIGISTESRTATAEVTKTIYREVSCKLSYSISNQSVLGNNQLAAGIGNIIQENYSVQLRARTGRATTVNIAWLISRVEALSLLQAPNNSTISLNLTHQF